ncbi:MAG: protein kinase domain-containing protein [Planctomycetota bacterium]|jgi:serine/threonine-protein kinase
MVIRSSGCDVDQLRRFVDDQLSEDAEAEMDRHLDGCEDCRRRLESLAAAPSWWSDAKELLGADQAGDVTSAEKRDLAGVSATEQPSLDFLAPTDDPSKLGRLGPYEISGVIGWGGMGVVLKGFDPALSRAVAIKVLAPQLAASGSARHRFAREARAAAAVDHEHVVAIHAVDSAGGFPYFVMPFIRGESLQRRIDRAGPLEVKEILRIGMQVAAGLAAAHAQGLVHRDVKPANLLLEHGVERVKITDFGLARTVDDASLTRSGVIAGTPQYMAPEQAKGDPIDHRADLFSLGSVMYTMCTGRSPFRAAATVAVLRRICDDVPRPVRQVNPDVPDWLEEIVLKLHEKDPADRFQSAAELAELLEQHLAHLQQPSAVPMPRRLRGRFRPLRGPPKRGLRRVIAAGILLAAAGFAALETAGVTRLCRFLAGGFEAPERHETPDPSSQRQTQPSVGKPEPDRPRVTVVTTDMIKWDDGLDAKFQELDGRIRILSEPNEEPEQAQPADALPQIGAHVEELRREVDGSSWP